MENKNRYELDGVTYDDIDAAVAAARVAVLLELENRRDEFLTRARSWAEFIVRYHSDKIQSGVDPLVPFGDVRFETAPAILPVNSTKVTGYITASSCSRPD